MPTFNIMLHFDPITRQTALPLDKDGQPYPLDWWHVTREQKNSVVVQVRTATTVLADIMKNDLNNQFLEDKNPPKAAPVPIGMTLELEGETIFNEMEKNLEEAVDAEPIKVTDATAVKAYLTTKTGVEPTELIKLPWTKPDEIIESVVKLHGATLESYKGSGLG